MPVYILCAGLLLYFVDVMNIILENEKSILFLFLLCIYSIICGFSVLFQYNAPTSQDRQSETWSDKSLQHTASQTSIFSDAPLSTKWDSLFADRESHLDSLLPSSTMSVYGQDSSLSGVHSSALSRVAAPIVTTVSYFNHSHVFFVYYVT